jgi:hypothetical protein
VRCRAAARSRSSSSTPSGSRSGIDVRCVDLRTLIRLEKAAGRPKDLEALAEVEAILDELAGEPSPDQTG